MTRRVEVPAAARDAWASIVGAANVIDDLPRRLAAARATFETHAVVPLIIRPLTTAEVQACVRVAHEHHIPIHPVSSGLNWGYGSGAPFADGVVLDLGRMRRILDFDERLAYVTVEPGVTQQQLYDFLQERGGRLWMDATGASPSASLIGNTVERGFGHTPYADHFAQACAFEVVLADGTRIDTGFARFGAAGLDSPIYRWGNGPVLDGLFTQSNLGIVTRMTIWLMPAPERFMAFLFRCDAPGDLGRAVDALRPLKLSGTLRSALHIGNDYKVLNGIQQYPWDLTDGRTPLTPDDMGPIRERLRIGRWNGSGGIYGTAAQVAEAKRLVRQQLAGVASRVQFIDDTRLRLARRFARPWQVVTGWDLSAAMALLEPVYGLLRGVPTRQPIATTYWRKRQPPPAQMDPDRDRCGLLWCAPVAPMEGGHAERLAALASDILLERGFEPLLSITLITERALTCVVSISYDRDIDGEDARALAAYHTLLDALEHAGYHSYRLALPAMTRTPMHDSAAPLLARLKHACDPHGVIAPGHYGIGRRDR